MSAVLHWHQPWFADRLPACSSTRRRVPVTEDRSRVTCERCRRLTTFKEAES
jgi:hypothetical protein